jgi:hypothetical protein
VANFNGEAEHGVVWVATESTGVVRLLAAFPFFRTVILRGLLLMTVAAWRSLGADRDTGDACSEAAAVLQRFTLKQEDPGAWASETIQVEASLPKLKKTGRLQAIRRLFAAGQPNYKVLEIAGDPMVTRQVIPRYISADEQTIGLPALSVALTPANYKIHYVGSAWLGNRLAYIFRVIPRKKRVGLINGGLWLDAETGIAIRESGYLAKNPSLLVKRIDLTRENELRDGKIEARITHVSVDTRLIGRAQLVIVEHPFPDELTARNAVAGGQ